jgi:hypothetical protein
MPPHCDSMDGPVVTAARRALEKEDVNVCERQRHRGCQIGVREGSPRS